MGGQVRHPSLDASFYSASDTPLSESKRVLRLCMPQWAQWVMFAPEGGVLAYCKGALCPRRERLQHLARVYSQAARTIRKALSPWLKPGACAPKGKVRLITETWLT
jgi:hypothetical protein